MNLPSLTNAAYEMHILVGCIVSMIALLFFRKTSLSISLKYTLVLILLLIVGLEKEVIDKDIHGKPDWIDILFTILGLPVWLLIQYIFTKKK